jgi:hypothetical protein
LIVNLMVAPMKPYLADYLRSRDRAQYEKFIRTLAGSSFYACRRFIRSTMEMMRPQLCPFFPSLSDAELQWMADEYLAHLDIPEEMPPQDPWNPKAEDYDNDDE